jgi:hypothetical protein
MRTKALFVAAAFGAAGLVSSMAQVYSVNVVGYVNTVLKPGYNLIANPLETTANTVADLFPGVDGMSVFKFVDGTYQIANYDAGLGEWDNPAITLNPGEGAFVFNPTDADVTVTFVGEIVEGTKTNELPVGWSMKSSQVPQAGGLVSALGFPVAVAMRSSPTTPRRPLGDMTSPTMMKAWVIGTSANRSSVLVKPSS